MTALVSWPTHFLANAWLDTSTEPVFVAVQTCEACQVRHHPLSLPRLAASPENALISDSDIYLAYNGTLAFKEAL